MLSCTLPLLTHHLTKPPRYSKCTNMLSCTPRALGHHISTQKTEFLSVTHAIADEHKPGPEPTGKGFRFIEGTRVTQSYILIAPKNGYSEQ
jgi:hypothetical protein